MGARFRVTDVALTEQEKVGTVTAWADDDTYRLIESLAPKIGPFESKPVRSGGRTLTLPGSAVAELHLLTECFDPDDDRFGKSEDIYNSLERVHQGFARESGW